MVAPLPLIIPIGLNFLNIVASYSSAAGKENIFSVFMSDKKKKPWEKLLHYCVLFN